MAMDCRTVDYHTAGEPFRIVLDGVPPIAGTTVRAKRETARGSEAIDAVRRLLCHEPRGHADMYGCFVVEPDDASADFGVLFWRKDGYSTACGHGTIALGRWAVESGRGAGPEVTIVGTRFAARALGETPEGLLTEVRGAAFRTGEHRFMLDPRDPLGTGFVLR
ncbi:hypothetical protein DSM104299_00643 [Baekduia alba]|nr:proline racemase family protein [Baekduia alba]WCB91964.1 hypothetical protein DSM104299_00643 [Baekduia alba]